MPEPTVPDAEPLLAPTALSPDTVLDRRYRLRSPVTSRGPVTLWRGDDEVLARAVAVRVVEHGDGVASDGREQAGRMLLEAAVNSGRLVHPGAASTYDATVTTTDIGRVSYVVSEWVEGKTLRQLASDGKMSPSQVASVVLASARVIAAAHGRGIHHGDLHPGDVIVSSHGTVKVIDIEIGGVLAKLDGSAPPLGSVEDPQLDDVRGLGALLYAGLTGRWPLGDDRGLPAAPRGSDGRLRSPRQVRSSVPRDLDAVTLAALGDERSAGSEISTAEELVEELAAIAPGDAVFDPGLLRLDGTTGTQAMPAGGWGPATGTSTAAQPPTAGFPSTSEYDAGGYPPRGYQPTTNYGPPRRSAARSAPEGYLPASAAPPRGGVDRTAAYGDRSPYREPDPYRDPERRPPAPAARGNRLLLAIVAAVLVLAMVGGVVAWLTTSGGDEPRDPGPTASSSAVAPPAGTPLVPTGTRSFDPLTQDPDKTENDGDVGLAFDGVAATAWDTSSYRDQLGGGFKDGVGLIMEFAEPVEVRQLDVTFNGSTGFQLLAGDEESSAIEDYTVAAEQSGATGAVEVPVDNAGAHRYWVLWLTELPQVGDGQFKGSVVDVALTS